MPPKPHMLMACKFDQLTTVAIKWTVTLGPWMEETKLWASQPNRLTVLNIALFVITHSFNAWGDKAPAAESKDITGMLVAWKDLH